MSSTTSSKVLQKSLPATKRSQQQACFTCGGASTTPTPPHPTLRTFLSFFVSCALLSHSSLLPRLMSISLTLLTQTITKPTPPFLLFSRLFDSLLLLSLSCSLARSLVLSLSSPQDTRLAAYALAFLNATYGMRAPETHDHTCNVRQTTCRYRRASTGFTSHEAAISNVMVSRKTCKVTS